MAEDASGPRLPEWTRRPLAALPLLLVTGLALWLVWPLPTGQMPLSADHTVHLTRVAMFAEQLSQGQLRGWDSTWFFGTPVGELYPVLGDLVIIALRGLSFGLLDWHQAYALGFVVVFAVQGWALLRVGKALGLGPVPGLVAALLCLADVGAYREGGWLYTVVYGVWPQALCTALTWLSLAELCTACEAEDPTHRRRRLATAALAMGAALLAHPMAMASIGIGGPLLVLTVGLRSREALRRTACVAAVGAILGLAIAAWWVVPMLQHRAWMASYGWMWQPLHTMATQASEGHWAQSMPTAVGMTVSLGLVLLVFFGSRTARFVAAFALVQWLLASRDTLWALRLDHLSEGFTHIQYQRFLIAAKPGLWLVAGAALALPLRGAARAWRHRASWARPLAAALVATSVGLGVWMITDQRAVSSKHDVGTLQLERIPGKPEFDGDYAQLLEWMRTAAEPGDGPPFRATVQAPRNLHWFMDAPALTGMRIYKQGFTPGDNFVHKPEAAPKGLLDRLRVRYVISAFRRVTRRNPTVATFGAITVQERPGWEEQPIAWLDGPGQLEVLEEDVDGGVVRVRVSGAGEGTRVVFGVAGFPRWTLHANGEPVEWLEVPVIGNGEGVTPAERRAGALRGGKAHGDDGSEPTLIAADVGDGELELRYHARRPVDMAAGLLSILSLSLCGMLLWRPKTWTMPTARLDALLRRLGPLGHPLLLGGLLLLSLVAAVVQVRNGGTAEEAQAVGWVDEGWAKTDRHGKAGLLKTDMLIRPAVLIGPRRKGPAQVVFPGVSLGDSLTGWIALDDDAAKQRRKGKHRVMFEVGRDGQWTTLEAVRLPHKPGMRPLSIETGEWSGQRVDVRVVVESEGERPPALGFDLDLGAAR